MDMNHHAILPMESILHPLSFASFANDYSPSSQRTRSLKLFDDDQVYDNYVATTIDPGNKLFIAALCICVGSACLLPLMVKRVRAKKNAEEVQIQNEESKPCHAKVLNFMGNALASMMMSILPLNEIKGADPKPAPPKTTQVGFFKTIVDDMFPSPPPTSHAPETTANAKYWKATLDPTSSKTCYTHSKTKEITYDKPAGYDEAQKLKELGRWKATIDANSGKTYYYHSKTKEVTWDRPEGYVEKTKQNKQNANKQDSNTQAAGNTTLEKIKNFVSTYDKTNYSYLQRKVQKSITYTKDLGQYDAESKRILRLAIPFMTNSLIKTIADLACLAVVSSYLGTQSAVSYAMVDVVVGVSSAFIMGWIETVNSLGSMAQGAGNYELVGQYLQIAILAYVICQIPVSLIWGFSMRSIMLAFGFSEDASTIAAHYVWTYMANATVFGAFQAFIDFLGLIDREQLGMMFSCSCDLSKIALVTFRLRSNWDATLTTVGWTVLGNTCLWLAVAIGISYRKQLTRPYQQGMIGALSFRNEHIVKTLMNTGLPLAVGGLLAYAEWEILTIFAAILGPAEAATWAMLGFVWDVFESTTEAIGDASEVRCAYQLGKGRPEMAKTSAYKSMLFSVVVSLVITTIFLCLSGKLPGWLTSDETIQDMLVELIPLVALGNITLTVGMVCWAIIGSQARYKLATSISLATSLLITIPLGAIMTLWDINLQGLVFSILMGYIACAWIMVVVIGVSDWDALSKDIVERVAKGDMDFDYSTDSSDVTDSITDGGSTTDLSADYTELEI